jgi:hypothetical protein
MRTDLPQVVRDPVDERVATCLVWVQLLPLVVGVRRVVRGEELLENSRQGPSLRAGPFGAPAGGSDHHGGAL